MTFVSKPPSASILRSFALTKNWLFAESESGGLRAAQMCSLISAAKLSSMRLF
jgi:hypothetical protein